MKRASALGLTAVLALAVNAAATFAADPAPTPAAAALNPHPNIVYILCDDLGIGDVHVFNPTRGKIATPNMDRLASEGILFTDAHSSDSVCTPSRYGL
jgi:arylsulfatase A-like enzyme